LSSLVHRLFRALNRLEHVTNGEAMLPWTLV
jgi:hypothetical protein